MGKKIKILEYQAIFSFVMDLSRIRSFQVRRTTKQSGLSGAGWADNCQDLSLVYLQGNVLQYFKVIKVFFDMFHF